MYLRLRWQIQQLAFKMGERPVTGTKLDQVDLSLTLFRKAKLKDVDLRTAKLYLVDFSGADLRGAKISDEQLTGIATLEGAKMPDGKRYEKWLKSRAVKK